MDVDINNFTSSTINNFVSNDNLGACEMNRMSLIEGIVTSIGMTCIYVGVLYIPFNNDGDRDSRKVILRRLISLTILTILNEIYIHFRMFKNTSNILVQNMTNVKHKIISVLISILLTSLLYSGHLIILTILYFRRRRSRERERERARRRTIPQIDHGRGYRLSIVSIRNYIISPLLEEIYFRRHFVYLYLLPSSSSPSLFGTNKFIMYIPCILFSLAHLHHVTRFGWIKISFQLAYTLLFGIYAITLYLHTNTLWSCYIAHIMCNVLELPDFISILAHRQSKLILCIYAVSIVTFILAFVPLTHFASSFQRFNSHSSCNLHHVFFDLEASEK